MVPPSQRPKGQDSVLSTLNVAIDILNLAKDLSGILPARAAFGSVSVLLTMIRDSMINDQGYVELGLNCADICKALNRGTGGKRLSDLSRSVREAINQLTTTVTDIQQRVLKQSERNRVSRIFHAKNDRDAIAGWKLELGLILQVFNTELIINTHMTVTGIRNDVSHIRRQVGGHVRSTQTSPPGESPPQAPRDCFGRDDLIKKIVGLAENLTPVALTGAGGIGKTSIALTVLHHHRVKAQFGENRRFIRCDQFPASRANFLRRLSKAIGTGVGNPENLNPLRSSLSSKKTFIVLDNAESILDPRGAHGQEIYSVVEELSQISNVCLCITSRITSVPPNCETLEIPTLSMEAARDAFHRIYKHGGRSYSVDKILRQLDFHPLSITLLSTIAHQNKWDDKRLAREWEKRQTDVLQTEHNKSLAATIELSLASPTFRALGPVARELLGAIAFFPQGVDESNLNWLFPTSSNGSTILDKFCMLSLTYRSDGFTTMLAPLRDYLRPKDPLSSPLLRTTKECYFTRMSAKLNPNMPGFRGARWIISEDANVEHLLSVLTSTDTRSNGVWIACINFMDHLYWHKPRQTVLRTAIEGLPRDHHHKPECLFKLARLFQSVGNHTEENRLLTHVLELERERGNERRVARTLIALSTGNRLLGLHEEGVRQAKEALEIYERFGDTESQAGCLNDLARLFHSDKQLDAAEDAASRAVQLLPERGQEFWVCQSHRILGDIYVSKSEREKAIHHFETALQIASPSNWSTQLFLIHYSLADLFSNEGEFEDACTHIERAESHTADNAYNLGRAIALRAHIWYRQRNLGEAKSEALRAFEIFEKLGAASGLATCKALLQDIERATRSLSASGESGSSVRPSRNSMNTRLPASANLTVPTAIRPSHSDSALAQTSSWRQSAVTLVTQRSADPQSSLPRHHSGPRLPPLPQQRQTTLSATHLIRLIPHVDSDDFFWFDPVSRVVEEGNSPLRIGHPSRRGDPNFLSFKSELVSRAHAEIWAETGGKFFVKDTQSAAGTFLNHVRLSPANTASLPFEIKDGDILRLGVTHKAGTEDARKCVKIEVEIKNGRQATSNEFLY